MRTLRACRKLAAVALFVFVSFITAAGQTPIPECVPGKLSEYLKLPPQGCTVGNYIFSDFRYHPSPGALPAGAISLTAGIAPGTSDPGLFVEAKWAAPLRPGSSLSYRVGLQPQGVAIVGVGLEMQFGQITGTGEAEVSTEVCPLEGAPDTCSPGGFKLRVLVAASDAKKVQDSGQFTRPTRYLKVVNVLSAVTGKNGSASFDGFMAVFHAFETSAPPRTP